MTFSSQQLVKWRPSPSLEPRPGEAPTSASRSIRDEEATASEVDDYQNFMQFYSTVAPHGRLTPMNLPRQSNWTSLSAGGFDGMAYNFIAARGGPKHSSLVGLAVMEGMVVPLADRVPHQAVWVGRQPAELFYGPMMGAWTTAALFAGEAGLTSFDGTWGTHLTLNSNGQARSDLTLLDKLDKTQAEAQGCTASFDKMCLRRSLNPSTDALRRVEIRRIRGPGAQAMPALSLFQQLQILCRIDYSSVCDVTFGTYVDDTAADLLAREKASFWGRFVKPTWRALWGLDALPVPDILQPKEMQPGDRVVERRWTRKTFLSAFGKLLVFLGFHGARFIQSSLTVERLLASAKKTAPTVRVELGFSSVKSGRFWAALVGNLTGHRGKHRMQREEHAVELKLNTARLLGAYRTVVNAARNGASAEEQVAFLRGLSEIAIEEGQLDAQYKKSDASGCSQTTEFGSSFVGLGLGLLAPWLPNNFSVGMSRRRVHSRHHIITDSGEHLRLTGTADIVKRGPDGERTVRMSARTWEPSPENQKLQGVTLETHISLGRADVSEVNRLIVDPLANHFHIPFNRASGAGNLLGAGWRSSRDVVYRQDCSCETLLSFAKGHLAQPKVASGVAPDPISRLAQDVVAIFTDGLALTKPKAADRTELILDAFHNYFRDADLPSFGTLVSSLATFEPNVLASLESECDAYEFGSHQQQDIAQKLDHATVKEANDILKYANTTIRPLLYQGRRLAAQDPFLSDESRADLIATLVTQEQALARTFQNYTHPHQSRSLAMRDASLRAERELKPYDF